MLGMQETACMYGVWRDLCRAATVHLHRCFVPLTVISPQIMSDNLAYGGLQMQSTCYAGAVFRMMLELSGDQMHGIGIDSGVSTLQV